MIHAHRLPFLLWFVLVLAGCSGGGGGGGGGIEPTLHITTANAGTVAAGAYGAQQDLGGTSDLILGISPFGAPSATAPGLLGLAKSLVDRHVLSRGKIRPLVLENCSGGGTVDITEDDGGDADPVGDSITLVYALCTEGELTLDGVIVLELTDLTGDPDDVNSNWSLEIEFTFDNLTLSADSESSTVDGSLAFRIAYDAAASSLTFTIGSDGLSILDGTGQPTISGDFRYSVTLSDTGPASVSFEFAVEIADGVVLVDTDGLTLASNGLIGSVTVRGAGASSLVLEFKGAGDVTVWVDENGDQMFECVQDLTVDTLAQFDPANC